MGRQRLQGMEYFDHWTNSNSDLKIKKLMAYFGVEGYGVYFYLLERIYSQPDYYLDFSDEDTFILLAEEMRIKGELFKSILEKCLKLDLFNAEMFENFKRLTSNGVLKRAQKVEEKRGLERDRKTFSSGVPMENEDIPMENKNIPTDNLEIPTEKCIEKRKEKEEKRIEEKIESREEESARGEEVAFAPQKQNSISRFKKPTVEEVSVYCKERKNSINPNVFVNFYESKGWKIGNSPMKDWKAAVRTWEQKEKQQMPQTNAIQNKSKREEENSKHLIDYDKL